MSCLVKNEKNLDLVGVLGYSGKKEGGKCVGLISILGYIETDLEHDRLREEND